LSKVSPPVPWLVSDIDDAPQLSGLYKFETAQVAPPREFHIFK
jgi:hypothetical protein